MNINQTPVSSFSTARPSLTSQNAAAADRQPQDTFQPSSGPTEISNVEQMMTMLSKMGVAVNFQQGGVSVADTGVCKLPTGESKVLEQLQAPLSAEFGDSAVLDLKDPRVASLRAFQVDKVVSAPLDVESILGKGWTLERQNDFAGVYQLAAAIPNPTRQRVTVNQDGYVNLHSMVPQSPGSREKLIHTLSVDREGQTIKNENWRSKM